MSRRREFHTGRRELHPRLQKKFLERRIKREYDKNDKKRIDPDDAIEQMGERLDPDLSYEENIHLLQDIGVLDKELPTMSPEDQTKRADESVQFEYLSSILARYYHCHAEGIGECDFQTYFKEDMKKHFQEEHGLKDAYIPPSDPYDWSYIILKELMNIAFSKENKKRKNFTVSNQYLWKILLRELELKPENENAPSNQVPRRILNDLGLLGSHRYQRKNKTGFDKNSRRVYHLNIAQLEDVIFKTEYFDLQARWE